MFLVINLLSVILYISNILLTAFSWLIIIRVLMSWISPRPDNILAQFIFRSTEPFLFRIRKMLYGKFNIGIDISPMIALILIGLLRFFLVKVLTGAANSLG